MKEPPTELLCEGLRISMDTIVEIKRLKRHKDHPFGYGFISDTHGSTIYGVSKEKLFEYISPYGRFSCADRVFTEWQIGTHFTLNGEIYKFRSSECPPLDIPKGTLDIYVFKQAMFQYQIGV